MQRMVQGSLQNPSAGGEDAVAVIRLAEQLLRDGVDHHISRSGIEGFDLFGSSPCWDGAEVPNSAQILQNTSAARMAEKHIVEEGDERRALAADGHVCRTKVRDHRRSD